MKQELLWLMDRAFKKDTYTIGRLGYKGFDENANVIGSVPFLCNTLEDKWSDFKNGIADKIAGKTAIPDGKYKIIIAWSPRFQRMVPHIQKVPYYTNILIHGGNRPEDTEGCVLPGKNDMPGWVSDSIYWEKVITELIRQYKESYIIIK